MKSDEGSCACYGENLAESMYDFNDTIESTCMLDFEIEERGQNLSVGMRQLVCIIRALLRKSKIVILDEPTSSIDFVTEQAIQNVIVEELKDHATVLMIAHRVNSILLNDSVLLISKGRIEEHGTIEKL